MTGVSTVPGIPTAHNQGMSTTRPAFDVHTAQMKPKAAYKPDQHYTQEYASQQGEYPESSAVDIMDEDNGDNEVEYGQ